MKHINKWIVYKIIDNNNNILYIGESSNIEQRFKRHKTDKVSRFYKRKDINIEPIKEFSDRKDAFEYQCKLQKQLGFKSDNELLISNAKKGRIATNEFYRLTGKIKREVLCYDYKTSNFIGEFESIRKASSALNVSNINNVLKGKYKQVGGYYFKYK